MEKQNQRSTPDSGRGTNQHLIDEGVELKTSRSIKKLKRESSEHMLLHDIARSLRIISQGSFAGAATDFEKAFLFFQTLGIETLTKTAASGGIKYLFIFDPLIAGPEAHRATVNELKKRYTALKFVSGNYAETHIPVSNNE